MAVIKALWLVSEFSWTVVLMLSTALMSSELSGAGGAGLSTEV